jgi:hypothetical protein
MGTQTTHVWTQKALNPAIYSPGATTATTQQRRRLTLERPQDGQFIGVLGEFDDGGTQSYHGMLLSIQRRAASGVTISGNYTWSHCIGDNADVNGMGPGANDTYQDPNNRDFDRGNCNSDRRHVFNLTAVGETPQFSRRNLRLIASGWRLSGIYKRSSGPWLTITAGTDRALTGIGNQRTNQVLGDPYGDTSGGPMTNYFNAAAFALPALGTLGNMGRNNIQGPGTWQFDMALSRIFRIRESQRLEFRAEAYNVTNSFRPLTPATAFNSNTFGLLNASQPPRIMQFALKYVF